MPSKLISFCLAMLCASGAMAADCIEELFQSMVGDWNARGYNLNASGELTEYRNELTLARPSEHVFELSGINVETQAPVGQRFELQDDQRMVGYPVAGTGPIDYRIVHCVGPRRDGSFLLVQRYDNTDPDSGIEFEFRNSALIHPDAAHWAFAARRAGTDGPFISYGAQLQQRSDGQRR